MDVPKNFNIFKNTKKAEGSNQPDYLISAKVGEEYKSIGGCWVKEGQSGKFFSCKISDPRPAATATTPGIPDKVAYPSEEINADEIPF